MIEVKHLTKRYGNICAVSDLSFTIEKGQIYGFLGPNGAGKSTTMNIMTGCLAATSGDVKIGGFDIFEESEQAKRLIGYLPEQPPLYPDRTPREYLTFVARAKGIPEKEIPGQLTHVMTVTQTLDVADRLIRNLSKGYKQRVGIAQAILGDPEVIILDEPTVGLDPRQIIEIRELIQQLGRDHTVILSSHQYTLEVPICRIQVTAGDTEYTIKIGEETSLTGERYCSIGDGNAYLVDADVLDAFSYGLYDVLKMEAIPDMSNIESMTLESDTQSYRIQYLEDSGLAYSDDYVWFLEGQALDTELTEALLDAVRDLEWTECAHFHVTDFAAYGLDEPAAVVSIDYVRTLQVDTGETDEEGNAIYETQSDEEAFVLSLSEASNGYCYARIGDSAMVYKVDADVLDTLRYTTEAELQPDEVMLMDWENVNGFDITLNGEVYQITKGTETVTDDEGNTSEETVYLLNGEQIDGAAIEDALDKLTFSGYAAGLTPARSEEFRIVIHRDREIFSSVEFAIYQYDSSQCLVTRDGEATVLANRETVVDLVETVNSLVLG